MIVIFDIDDRKKNNGAYDDSENFRQGVLADEVGKIREKSHEKNLYALLFTLRFELRADSWSGIHTKERPIGKRK